MKPVWRVLRLAGEPKADLFACLRAAQSIGRPLGDDRFLAGSDGSGDPSSQASAGRSRQHRRALLSAIAALRVETAELNAGVHRNSVRSVTVVR
jgi:hypothetical protein